MSEGLYEDEEELSYSREDGDTWKTSGGEFGGKYKGDIDYFDSEDKAKVFAKSGKSDNDADKDNDTKDKEKKQTKIDTNPYDDKKPSDEPKGDPESQYKDALKKANDLANSQYDDQGNPNPQGASNKQINMAFKKAKDLEDEIRSRDKKAKEKEDEPKKKKGFFNKMFGKKESVKVINGKKYKAIKESKKSEKHPIKEQYERLFSNRNTI